MSDENEYMLHAEGWTDPRDGQIAADAAELAALRARVAELGALLDKERAESERINAAREQAEALRDAYKRDLGAELAGAADLRKEFGARDGETMHAFVARLAQAEADAARLQSLYDRSHDWQQHDALLDALRQAHEWVEAADEWVTEDLVVLDPPDRERLTAALAAVRKVLGGAP